MELTAYRNLSAQLQANLEADPRVLALLAMGSMAETSRLPDEWSDHDFLVITVPGVQEDLRQDLRWLPHHDQIVLTIRETAHGLKVLYAFGHLLEFAVFDSAELRTARANDYRVLFDRAAISALMAELAAPPATDQARDLGRDAEMVLALIFVGMGRYGRGEHLSAHAFLKHHLLHHLLPALTATLPAEDKARLDNLDPFRRVEQVLPQVGAQINAALLMPLPQAALAWLALLEQHIRPALPDFPDAALATVREYIALLHK